jgi:hypothetical protein
MKDSHSLTVCVWLWEIASMLMFSPQTARGGPVGGSGRSAECCCGILSAPPVELPLTQRTPFGTTAWRISMYCRQVVESVNAALQGAFADISRGFFRVFGRTKITFLLGFTIAAFNLDRLRNFRAKQAEEEGQPRRRAKRRLGTWAELMATPNDTIVDDREDRPD